MNLNSIKTPLSTFSNNENIQTLTQETTINCKGKFVFLINGSVSVIFKNQTTTFENNTDTLFLFPALSFSNQDFSINIFAGSKLIILSEEEVHILFKNNLSFVFDLFKEFSKTIVISNPNLNSLDKLKLYIYNAYSNCSFVASEKILLTRQELATKVGISLRTLSRCVASLHDNNLISLVNQEIRISKTQFLKIELDLKKTGAI